MTELKYKWANPHEWLESKAQVWSADELYQALMSLAHRLDSDSIQDLFQTEMDEDGYFEELKELGS